jgi:hypothetical protein
MKKFQLHIVFFFPFNWNYYNNRIIFEDFKDSSVYNETFQYVYFFQISEKKFTNGHTMVSAVLLIKKKKTNVF